jgi:exodeoxyribonuclease VII large subunit
MMQNCISVSELNNQIKSLLETTFLSVSVEGEISRVTYHSSGHLYFTIKDANSSISCVMFKGNNQKLKFRVEEGLNIIAHGNISVYSPRGTYQINCLSLEPAGSGTLALAYEQLKKKLEEKGYFNKFTKKSLPTFPKAIAVVTSKTGAALQDMLRVAKKRWPLLKIILLDTIVQGESAALNIANNIKKADMLGVDIIVTGRGGGSLEDLWAFNEEIVADAIHQAKAPVVSAVGHEIDFLISDFVADLRAPTPSAAFEMILPDKNEMFIYMDNIEENFHNTFKRIILKKSEELKNIYYSYKQNSLQSKIVLYKKEIATYIDRFYEIFSFLLRKKEDTIVSQIKYLTQKQKEILNKKEQILFLALKSLEANNPKKKTKSTYAQIVKDHKPTDLEKINPEDIFELISIKTIIKAKALEKLQH